MRQRQKILVVDDELEIRRMIGEVLSDQWEVHLAANALEGLRLARKESPDVILLDIMMPEMDGVGACQALRSDPQTREIPVIMLTALKGVADRTRAFDAGADDYIPKPFFPEELIARVESKLRRVRERRESPRLMPDGRIVCGNLVMHPESYSAYVNGQEIGLTVLEFNLVRFLVENSGKLKTRQEIMEAVWKNAELPSRILDPHILAVRKKLEGFDHVISTIYGAGYVIKPAQ